jgi:hypothetical protein
MNDELTNYKSKQQNKDRQPSENTHVKIGSLFCIILAAAGKDFGNYPLDDRSWARPVNLASNRVFFVDCRADSVFQ